MNDKKDKDLQLFLESIAELYENIESWLDTTSIQTDREEIELKEEHYGTYKAQKLIIKNTAGKSIAEVVPVGASVIGANGRVDLIGRHDRVIIVSLEKGGPTMTTTVSCGDNKETSVTKFYRGVEEAGWYWVEDRRRGKAHKIDQEIFYELLEEVSDYEVRKSVG